MTIQLKYNCNIPAVKDKFSFNLIRILLIYQHPFPLILVHKLWFGIQDDYLKEQSSIVNVRDCQNCKEID